MVIDDPGDQIPASTPFISSFEDLLRLTSYGSNSFSKRVRYTLVFPAAVLMGAIMAELVVMMYPVAHSCSPFKPLVGYENSSDPMLQAPNILDAKKTFNNFSTNGSNICDVHLPSAVSAEDDKNILICPAGFEWDSSAIFTGSLVRKLEWICKRRQYYTSAIFVLLYGFILGGMVAGAIADSVGRMKTLGVACLLNAIFRICILSVVYIPHQIIFWIVLFFYSSTLCPIIVLPLVTATENFNNDDRARIFPAITALYPLGFTITLFLYSESSLWYYIFVVLFTIFLSIPIFGVWSTIYEESLRWLYFNQKIENCARILRYVAVANDVTYFSKEYYKTCLIRLWEERGPQSVRYSEASFSWTIYFRAVFAAFPWFFNAIMIVLSIMHVPVFQNINLMGVESLLLMSFCILTYFPVKKLIRFKCVGRSCTQIILYTLAIIFNLFMYKYQKATGLVGLFVLLTWTCLVMSSSISFMMSVELMPTITRAMHIGTLMGIAAIFGFTTYVFEEMMIQNSVVNGEVFVFCAVTCAIAMLPVSLTIDTEDTNLPDTYRDVTIIVQDQMERREV